MKLSSVIKVLLLSLALAPVFGLWGVFLLAASAHSGGVFQIVGLCMAPGVLVAGWVPDAYWLPFVVGVEFFLVLALGLLFLKFGPQAARRMDKRMEAIVAKLFRD